MTPFVLLAAIEIVDAARSAQGGQVVGAVSAVAALFAGLSAWAGRTAAKAHNEPVIDVARRAWAFVWAFLVALPQADPD
jgi:hypothetical protein